MVSKVLGFLGLKSLAIAFFVFIYPVLFFFYAPQKGRNFSVMTALFFSILYKKKSSSLDNHLELL